MALWDRPPPVIAVLKLGPAADKRAKLQVPGPGLGTLTPRSGGPEGETHLIALNSDHVLKLSQIRGRPAFCRLCL